MICVHTLKYKFLLSTVQENKCNTNLLISQRKYGFLIKLCTHFYIYVWVHSILVHQQIDVAIDPVSFYLFTPWCERVEFEKKRIWIPTAKKDRMRQRREREREREKERVRERERKREMAKDIKHAFILSLAYFARGML